MKRFLIAFAGLALLFLLPAFKAGTQANTMPRISVLVKNGQKTFTPGATIQYNISVEDKEDGSSKYDEIAGSEAFLEIRYLPDSAQLKKYLDLRQVEAPVLLAMKKGTCFNCHALNRKMAGPPFSDVLARHAGKPALTDYLAGKIINGSKGVWGDSQVMPSHPEITKEQAKAIAAWIQKKGKDPNYDLQTGLEGKFSTVVAKAPASAYLLIASYLDHGINGMQQLEAKQVVTLTSK